MFNLIQEILSDHKYSWEKVKDGEEDVDRQVELTYESIRQYGRDLLLWT